jgi:hypothetical protein
MSANAYATSVIVGQRKNATFSFQTYDESLGTLCAAEKLSRKHSTYYYTLLGCMGICSSDN